VLNMRSARLMMCSRSGSKPQNGNHQDQQQAGTARLVLRLFERTSCSLMRATTSRRDGPVFH
jgi:hypothetical protein